MLKSCIVLFQAVKENQVLVKEYLKYATQIAILALLTVTFTQNVASRDSLDITPVPNKGLVNMALDLCQISLLCR